MNTHDMRPAAHRGRFALVARLARLHGYVFAAIERALSGWFTGLAARLVFASVLLVYYLNSAWLKFGEGVFGFLNPTTGAFASILPKAMEAHGFDKSALPFFPYHIIVHAGMWSELLLPLMIVAGLFSRIAALGMIGFVMVQSYVDITGHGLDEKSIGHMFDRFPDAIIWDQRLLWVFVLMMIVIHGPGRLSLDHLLARTWQR
ncbi:DoxX family protein [Mesorhizobium xinjiangense]|uniref:DoxX family protein n=1 Tax=Mesorhizobium xinjiangense TaxID=2678685 RepID=UPI001F164C55|nr:DoxX family protein [Mesorhizobium xinjiangense]